MRNKLQTNVAKSPLIFSLNLKAIPLKSPNIMCGFKNKILLFISLLFISLFGKLQAQISETFDSGIPASWSLFNNAFGTIDWQTIAFDH